VKTLNSPLKFMAYCIGRAIRHPKTPIAFYYCSSCKLRFNSKEGKCPKCGEKVGNSPDNRQESPVPWFASVTVIVVGVGSWIASAYFNIPELAEASRALVYIPLGGLFGMSIKK